MSLIKIQDIVKSYDRLQVLKGINMTVDSGEIVSIVGPSGAGKTTLLQIMGSLDVADSGSVMYEGENILAMNSRRQARFRNRNIGFVFQFHQLLPEFTMEENVAMPAMIAGDSRSVALAKARKLIDYLGLSERATHKPAELSGGERQRTAVARALINEPKVILADEPSGSLDSQNKAELHRLFFDLRRDLGQTFVIVTHDEHLASEADRTIVMADGEITDVINRCAI